MLKVLLLTGCIALGLGACAALSIGGAVSAVPNWIAVSRLDPVVADDDLAVLRPSLADADNGYRPLERAVEQLVWPETQAAALETLLEPHGWDDELARTWVSDNEAALRDLVAASRAPGFQSPPVGDLDQEPPELPSWKRLIRVLSARAVLHALAGDEYAAVDDIVAGLDLAHHFRMTPVGALGHGLIGVELQDLAVRGLLAALPHLDLSAARSRALTLKLSRYSTDPASWRRTWAGEYQGMKRVIVESRIPGLGDLHEKIDSAGLPDWLREFVDPDYFYKPNETVALYADTIRHVQTLADQPCSAMGSLGEEPDFGVSDVLRPNAIGRVLVGAATTGIRRFELRRCESDTLLGAARAQVALRAWWTKRGDLPQQLDELIPEYIADVPRDAFDDQTLRWRAEERSLQSAGFPAVEKGKKLARYADSTYPLAF